MKNLKVIIPTLALLVTSCIPSLYPLYTKETLAFKAELIGSWEDNDHAIWKFEKGKEQSYLLTILPEDEEEEYLIHLVKLDGLFFLDFFPSGYEEKDYYSLVSMVPTHSFAKIDFLNNNQIQVKFFDNGWLKDLFEQRKIRIKHETLEDGTIVLTANSHDLQQFVIKYANEPNAYIDPFELNRLP